MVNTPAIFFSPSHDSHFSHLLKSAMQTASSPFPTRLLSPQLLWNRTSEITSALRLHLCVSQCPESVHCVPDTAVFCTFYTFSHFTQQSHKVGITVISIFERGGNWGSEKLSKSSALTWLVGGGAGTQAAVVAQAKGDRDSN